jgi:hypothetical protein
MMQEHVWDAAGEFRVIAPSTKAIRTLLAVLGSFTALGALITFTTVARGAWTVPASRAFGTGLTMLLIGGLFFVFLWLWSANVRLLIGQQRVGYRNFFRRNHFWSKGEIDRAVDMAVSYGRTSNPQRGIYFFGPDGRRELVLSSRVWHAQDLKDFVDATGLRLDYRDAPVKAKDARREFPKAFGWAAQHNFIAGCSAMVLAVGLVLGGYALLLAVFHK